MDLAYLHDRANRKKIITIAVVVVIVAVGLVSVLHLNGYSLDFSNRQVRYVPTDSMDGAPTGYEISTIPTDSLVMIKNLDQSQVFSTVKVGDVLAFNQWGEVFVHRIIAIDEVNQIITTHGDNTPAGANETVYLKDVVGVVVGVSFTTIPGHIIGLVQDNHNGVFILAAVVIVLVALWAVYDYVKDRKKGE